ncbi:MAG: SCO family protein [Saprospiraceae bacterium]|nr:SCO family protein [Saprospiraceae bacterium]
MPILGEIEIVDGDTVYHSIPDFSLVDHHGDTITNQTFDQSLYVADFFLQNAPLSVLNWHNKCCAYTIVPGQQPCEILSHSIDPKYDTVAALKNMLINLASPTALPGILCAYPKMISLSSPCNISLQPRWIRLPLEGIYILATLFWSTRSGISGRFVMGLSQQK